MTMMHNTSGTPVPTTTTERETTTTSTTSSSSTRVRAYAREEKTDRQIAELCLEPLLPLYHDVIGRPMPRFTQEKLLLDLEEGTPGTYYRYALEEAANAPMPSWRYVLAIVARLKRQQVDPFDLIF